MTTATKERRGTGTTLCLSQFVEAVKTASMAVPNRSGNSAIMNVCVGNGLVTGTDMDWRVDVDMLEALFDPVLLPKDRLLRILHQSRHPDDKITIVPRDSVCVIKIGTSEWRLPTESAANYPVWEPDAMHSMLSLAGDEFTKAMRSVIYAVDRYSSRYALGGVCIECVDDKASFVATDGHMLSVATVGREAATDDFVASPESGKQRKAPIVPTQPLACLMRSARAESTVLIECDDRTFRGSVLGVTVTARLIEGRFPDWRGLVSDKTPGGTSINRDTLKSAVTAAAVVSTENSRGVTFVLRGETLTLSARSADAGQSKAQCVVEESCGDFSVTLDPKFVTAWLKPFTPNDAPCVRLHVCPPDGKTVFRIDEKYQGVIMPLAKDDA